jgi:hypothetical protein
VATCVFEIDAPTLQLACVDEVSMQVLGGQKVHAEFAIYLTLAVLEALNIR